MTGITTCWHLGLVQDCNMRCAYCTTAFGTYGLSRRLLARDDWPYFFELVYSRLAPNKRVRVECGGGETFVYYEEFLRFNDEFIEFGDSRGFKPVIEVHTNGSLLDRGRIDQLQERNVSLVFSIDGPAAVHDHFRRTADKEGTHAKALENWRYSVRDRPPMELNRTVASVYSGLVGLDELSDFWGGEGVAVFPCMVRLPKFRAAGEERAEWLALQQRYLRELRQLAVRYIKVGFPRVFEDYSGPADLYHFWRDRLMGASRKSCGAGRTTLGVAADGRLFPCSIYTSSKVYQLGDLHIGIDEDAERRYLMEIAQADALCPECEIRDLCPKCCFGQYPDQPPVTNVLDGCGFAKAVSAIAEESWCAMTGTQDVASPHRVTP